MPGVRAFPPKEKPCTEARCATHILLLGETGLAQILGIRYSCAVARGCISQQMTAADNPGFPIGSFFFRQGPHRVRPHAKDKDSGEYG
jgi:hypothetical protein